MAVAGPTAELAITWVDVEGAADPIVNVLHFQALTDADEWTIVTLVDLMTLVGEAWTATLGTVFLDAMVAESIYLKGVVPSPAPSITLAPEAGQFENSDTGDAMNPWENVVCNHATDRAGATGRGRTFMWGGRSSFVDSSGTVDATWRGQVRDQWAAFRAACVAGSPSVAQVVYSRKDDDNGIVLGTLPRQLVGIQRDRRHGSR